VALHVQFNHCSSGGQDIGADLPEDESMRLLVSFAAAIALAATAQADPSGSDADFISALNNAGITYHNAPDAVAIGRRACELMGQGHAEADVIKSMTQANPGSATTSPPDSPTSRRARTAPSLSMHRRGRSRRRRRRCRPSSHGHQYRALCSQRAHDFSRNRIAPHKGSRPYAKGFHSYAT